MTIRCRPPLPGASDSILHGLVLAGLLSLVGLAGCSSGGGARPATGTQAIAGAATAPLSDLNLVQAKIPAALRAAHAAPYAMPATPGCAALGDELAALDEALGPDLDAPAGAPADWRERGQDAAGDAAVDALRNTAEGVLPFRGWVRKLTGAERHSREVAAAVAAGTVRRAFLKGLGQAAGCAPPAAPLPGPGSGPLR
jgi:hypothetical protein